MIELLLFALITVAIVSGLVFLVQRRKLRALRRQVAMYEREKEIRYDVPRRKVNGSG